MIAGIDYGSSLWYLGRGTGVVSLFMLTVVMALGIAVHLGSRPSRVPAFAVTQVHRNAALLAVVFLVVHIASVVIDPYVTLRWVDVIVPFVSSYRPLWLGFGTLAFDLLLAILVTSFLRARLGRRAWKAVHYSAYAVFPFVVVHGLGTGTDLRAGVYLLATVGCATVVSALVWRRASTPNPRARQRLTPPAHARGAPPIGTKAP